MARTLRRLGHAVEREVRIPVYFDEEVIGIQRIDMLVESKVIVENKSTFQLSGADSRQLTNYLTASTMQVGLLLHFGPEPKFYRFVCTRSPRGSNPPNPQLPP
jgi:GxxExxY protein